MTMKRMLAFCIAILTLLLSLSILHVVAWEPDEVIYPEPDDGFWSTYRSANAYPVDQSGSYRPTVGFFYDIEGFHTVSRPDMWMDTTPPASRCKAQTP